MALTHADTRPRWNRVARPTAGRWSRRRRRCPTSCPPIGSPASGMPVRAIRDELRQIADVRNVGSVALCWVQAAVTIGFALVVGHPLAWLAAFVFMGPVHARFAILMHEAAHKLLFTNKRANDVVGRWLGAYPGLRPARALPPQPLRPPPRRVRPRRARPQPLQRLPDHPGVAEAQAVARPAGHVGLEEPQGPAPGRPQGGGLRHRPPDRRRARSSSPSCCRRSACSSPAGSACSPTRSCGSAAGSPSGGSSTGCGRSPSTAAWSGRRTAAAPPTTSRQSWLARFWIVPFNTGWHLAHHVDMGVPWRNLPALHRELVDVGLGHRGDHLPELPGALAGALEPPRVDLLEESGY